MRKVFALLSVAAVFAFASCEEKKHEEAADTTAVVVPAADTTAPAPMADTVKVDTVKAEPAK
jgi:hypothetical protein